MIAQAHELHDVPEPLVMRYRHRTLWRYFRADAAFAIFHA